MTGASRSELHINHTVTQENHHTVIVCVEAIPYNQKCIRESTQVHTVVWHLYMFRLNDITVAVSSTSQMQGVGHEYY